MGGGGNRDREGEDRRVGWEREGEREAEGGGEREGEREAVGGGGGGERERS